MGKLISLSIEVSAIDRTKVIIGKTGRKYYNMTLSLNDQPDKYGNHVSIFEPQTKEERDDKAAKKYLGTGKVFWESKPNTSAPAEPEGEHSASSEDLGF